MIMESRHGKGMHDTQERAALLLDFLHTSPSYLSKPQDSGAKRFSHLLQPKEWAQGFWCVQGAGMGSWIGIIEPGRAPRSESFPAYPSASIPVCQHIRVTADVVLPLAQKGGEGNQAGGSTWPGCGPGSAPDSAQCPHIPFIPSLLA